MASPAAAPTTSSTRRRAISISTCARDSSTIRSRSLPSWSMPGGRPLSGCASFAVEASGRAPSSTNLSPQTDVRTGHIPCAYACGSMRVSDWRLAFLRVPAMVPMTERLVWPELGVPSRDGRVAEEVCEDGALGSADLACHAEQHGLVAHEEYSRSTPRGRRPLTHPRVPR